MKANLIKVILLKATIVIALFALLSSNAQAEDVVWEKKLGTTHAIFSPDGTKIFANGGGNIYVLKTETGEILHTYPSNGYIIGFSPDGKYYYTNKAHKIDAETNEVAVIWNDERIPYDFKLGGKVAITGDKKHLIYACQRPGQEEPHDNIIILDAETLEFIKLMSIPGEISCLSASSDGKYFAISSSDGRWDEISTPKVTLWDALTFEKISTLIVEEQGAAIENITFSPDSKMFAASFKGKIIIYDMDTMEKIEGIECITETQGGKTIVFSPNSEYLVWGTSRFKDNYTKIARIKPCEITYDSKHLSSVFIKVSPNAKYLLTQSSLYFKLLNANWDGTSVKDFNNNLNLNIYPNPTDINTEIEYILPVAKNIVIEIINQEGISNILFKGFANQGKNTFNFNTNEYSSGQYFIRLRFADKEITQKLIISK